MFAINETVMYGANGVCTITEITTKKVGKESIEYYVLKPVGRDSSTLFVPTHNETLVKKMRYTLTKEQITDILNSANDSESKWIDNKNERFDAFKAIVSEGECSQLLSLIRLIHNHESEQLSKGKKLHMADERFLKEAEKMVCSEFSLVLDVSQEEALSIVLKS